MSEQEHGVTSTSAVVAVVHHTRLTRVVREGCVKKLMFNNGILACVTFFVHS